MINIIYFKMYFKKVGIPELFFLKIEHLIKRHYFKQEVSMVNVGHETYAESTIILQTNAERHTKKSCHM